MTSRKETITQCFRSIRGDFSADRVVVDPDLNERFILACHDAGLKETAVKLNRQLLNIRKKGLLPRSGRAETNSFPNEEDYRFAAEIGTIPMPVMQISEMGCWRRRLKSSVPLFRGSL